MKTSLLPGWLADKPRTTYTIIMTTRVLGNCVCVDAPGWVVN